jgi:hypothetical protein
MNETELTEVAISLGVLMLAYILYRRGRREQFRVDIRRIRDGLFDWMWQNGHSFSDLGYRATREMLNGLLRMSNTLSLSQLLLMMVLYFRWNLGGESGECDARKSPNKRVDEHLERVKRDAATKDWITRQSKLLVQEAAMLSPTAGHHGT